MNSPFLVGMLAAWAAAHLGIALFFTLAHFIGRKEQEYLLFGLLCATFSALTVGMALDFSGASVSDRFFADQITHAAAILAAVVNLHFALTFAGVTKRSLVLPLLYALACAFAGVAAFGLLWVPGSYHTVSARAFGLDVSHSFGRITFVGKLYYLTGALQTFYAVGVLFRAYRRGKREVLSTLITLSLVGVATVNDVGLDMGLFRNTLVMLPHVFMLYALGTAGSLLLRYRRAAGELELTASNLRQRTEELRHSYAELAQIQSELVTKKQLAAVGELAAAIAHEVRNPLAVIVNAVAGLRRTLPENDRKTLLNIVEEEAGRLNRLVTDLLRFARPVNVKRSPVTLPELANRSRAGVGDGFQIEVQAEDPTVHVIDADPNLLRLVFDNLVANACQAMGDAGVVQVRLERAELHGSPAVRIEIRDRGHGMEPEVLERALDPFFTTRPSGTGLGLPIVQRIIEAHGGELLLDSADGDGTRVIMVLPMQAKANSEAHA